MRKVYDTDALEVLFINIKCAFLLAHINGVRIVRIW